MSDKKTDSELHEEVKEILFNLSGTQTDSIEERLKKVSTYPKHIIDEHMGYCITPVD